MVTPPEGVPLWWCWTALGLATLIFGIAKSGFGGGVGIVAVPLVANALRVEDALGVMLPLLIVADIVAVRQHGAHRSLRHLRPSLLGALIGIGVGSLVLVWFREQDSLTNALNVIVGGTCLFFVALHVYRLAGGVVPRLPDSPRSAVGAGLVCGVVSTLAHAAGPVMSIYLLELRLQKSVLVGTLVTFFLVVNAAKVPTYVALGLIQGPSLLTAACVLPLVPVGAACGLWMHRRVPEKPFVAIMYVGAALAGLRMLLR